MKYLVFVLISFIIIQNAHTQEIEMSLDFWGYKFVKDGERINWKQLKEITSTNPEAHSFIKKAKSNHTISSILAFASGATLGIPLGQSINGVDANWELAYIAGGLFVIAIPFSTNAFNKVNKGVDTYNLDLHRNKQTFNPEFNVLINNNGIGLAVNF